MALQRTIHIHLKGRVQGVGFRPFVYRLARKLGLRGWVTNGNDGVHIEVQGAAVENFQELVVKQAPPRAKIEKVEIRTSSMEAFSDFSIRTSDPDAEVDLSIAPDFAMCPVCREELYLNGNRRQDYPFITCTLCGPRFSITTALPYDRERTSMASFAMCPECQTEYQRVEDRRYYSQTNSCPVCAVKLSVLYPESDRKKTSVPDILKTCRQYLEDGNILALKGIGGFLLLCDATNATAVQRLRNRKHRPSKPFAVMYPGLSVLKADLEASPEEVDSLTSPAAPIILLAFKEKVASGLAIPEVAPGLNRIGAMLPYAPLFDLLLHDWNKPIIATSGNVSGSPIIHTDPSALEELSSIADLIVTHNREIHFAQDDSVLGFAPSEKRPVFYRRSRGFAPACPVRVPVQEGACILAMGAEMKGSFTIATPQRTYVSPYLGDLDNFLSQQTFEKTLHRFLDLIQVRPTHIATDLHPNFYTTELGKRLSKKWKVPIVKVQHHQAHFEAILAEVPEKNPDENILGFIWDGTGLGEDDQIWGTECFWGTGASYRHAPELFKAPYFPLLAGDKMAREPRLSAFSLLKTLQIPLPEDFSRQFTTEEIRIYDSLWKKGGIKTRAMGRIFDAVAALLGLPGKVSFEGEAPMLLESLAWKAFRNNLLPKPKPPNDLGSFFRNILEQKEKGVPVETIALGFHYWLVEGIRTAAGQTQAGVLAFSGGVFQNLLLVELIEKQLSTGYQLQFHKHFSPNDENISLGQALYLAKKFE